MRRVFADTVYWIALANPLDQWHLSAMKASQSSKGAGIVTTEEVLVEFLAHFSGGGRRLRKGAVRYVESVLGDPGIVVLPQSHDTFMNGLTLYKKRPDKEYSLVDCISMESMRQQSLTDVLTHDDHFAQEGFIVLM
jgi:predicted nucleic acid-binding protein